MEDFFSVEFFLILLFEKREILKNEKYIYYSPRKNEINNRKKENQVVTVL